MGICQDVLGIGVAVPVEVGGCEGYLGAGVGELEVFTPELVQDVVGEFEHSCAVCWYGYDNSLFGILLVGGVVGEPVTSLDFGDAPDGLLDGVDGGIVLSEDDCAVFDADGDGGLGDAEVVGIGHPEHGGDFGEGAGFRRSAVGGLD